MLITDGNLAIFTMALSVIVFITYLHVERQERKTKLELYQAYETAPSIVEAWDNSDVIGTCHYCGMADSPIVIGWKDPLHFNKCKWCAELDNISRHIANRGQFNQAQAKQIPPPPKGKGGGSPRNIIKFDSVLTVNEMRQIKDSFDKNLVGAPYPEGSYLVSYLENKPSRDL